MLCCLFIQRKEGEKGKGKKKFFFTGDARGRITRKDLYCLPIFQTIPHQNYHHHHHHHLPSASSPKKNKTFLFSPAVKGTCNVGQHNIHNSVQ